MDIETNDIKHEHLASIKQHDWYIRCHQNNDAVALEDATYCVIVKYPCDIYEISFTCLNELNIWASF